MGLIVPRGPSWQQCTTNAPTGVPSSPIGTSVTAGANNADGAAVTALSALSHDVEYLVVAAEGFNGSNVNGSTLINVLYDPAGGTSWQVLIPYLACGYCMSSSVAVPVGRFFFFPVWIPAGSSVGLQGRTAHTSNITGEVFLAAYGGNSNPASWWCGQKVSAYGLVEASSRGTLVTPGVASDGSWTNLGSVLSHDCGAVQWVVQGQAVTTGTSRSYRFEFGTDGKRIGPELVGGTLSTEQGHCMPTGAIFADIRSGAQLQARGRVNSSAVDLDCAAYVVH